MRSVAPHRTLLAALWMSAVGCAEPSQPAPDLEEALADTAVEDATVDVAHEAEPDIDAPDIDAPDTDAPDATPDVEETAATPITLPPECFRPILPPPEWPTFEATSPVPVHPPHTGDCSSEEGLSLYLTRIEPLVNGSKPVSCNQCHLSGIDMGLYVQDTPCQTMACLVDAGEVDLTDPPASEILARILGESDPASALITSEVIAEEHDGVLEWITWSASCQSVVCPPYDAPCGDGDIEPPEASFTVPLGACDEDALAADFDARVFRWRGRCAHCHNTCKDGYPAPCWVDTDFDSEDPVAQRVAAMHTMYNLIGIGAIDVAEPDQSLFILKPLDEASGGVFHGGGKKMVGPHDQAYQDFVLWAEGYATCYGGETPQAPAASITEPLHKKKFDLGELVTFEGDAIDPQDGPLPDEALVWTSELLDVPFGTGRGPFEAALPLGDQVVTLTATDGDDNLGTWTIIVRIREPE